MPRKVNSKNPPVASSEEEVFQGVLVTHPAGVGNAAPATEVTVDLPPRPQAPEELQSPPPRGEAGAVSPQRGPMEGWQELKAEVARLRSMVAHLVATSRTEGGVDELLV
ncbi:unnamed protein product [Lampetra planeri]